ncbi:Uncharacterised protein [Legionella busanensis]|uniref:Uncharacterized protein n=1 Tax=Legionella busanensis TaxID=190655 RepID=A0A378JGB6_9GAMM|nr:hypothetical protein [Legionella busanensis]STX50326.1 Uncharacterised protein [Legionella busanensis]
MKNILGQFFKLKSFKSEQQAALSKIRKVKVIAINISHKDPKFISYKLDKKVTDKMALILAKIKSAYEIAYNLDPDSEILITWREYGLTDASRSKSINNDDKKDFLVEIQNLVKINPTLSVLVGPTLIRKEQTLKEIPKLKAYYNELSWVGRLESPNISSMWGTTINKHFQANQKVIGDMVDEQKFRVVKNSAYFVKKDSIQPIAKKAPYREIEQHTAIDFSKCYGDDFCKPEPATVFRPGKGRSKSSYFTLPNGKQALLQICREHMLGVVVPFDWHNKIVDAHFVLSASIPPQLDKIRGKHAFFVDNDYFPLHIVSNIADLADESMDLSVLSLFDDSNTLVKVKSFCPIQFYLISFLETLPYLDFSCKNFIELLKNYITLETIFTMSKYENIVNLINKHYKESYNSPAKRVMLYETMLRVVEELQIRFGSEYLDKFLPKNNKVPLNKKELVMTTLEEARKLQDLDYLSITAKIAGIDLDEKDFKGLFIYELGDYRLLSNDIDQPLDFEQTGNSANVGDVDIEETNDGAQLSDIDKDDVSQDLLGLTI